MSAGNGAGFFAPLLRGVASGFFARGGFCFRKNQTPRSRSAHDPLHRGSARKQQGFTYIGFLIAVAVSGLGLVAFAEVASHAMQREKEAELLFRGNQYREAIAAYHRIEGRYPQSLDQLLQNKGFSMPVRHLRKMYTDPMTGEADWVVVEAPDGTGIMGVHSRSEAAPIKTGNFSAQNQAFADAQRYADWKFVHSPAGLSRPIEKAAPK